MDFMTYVAGSGSGLDTNTMQAYVDDALASTAIITSVSVVFLLLILGLCVISIGLHRAGIIPFWLVLLVSFGTVGGAAAAGAGRDGSTSGDPELIGSI